MRTTTTRARFAAGVAAAALLTATAGCATAGAPIEAPTGATPTAPPISGQVDLPVAVGRDLWVGGERVPGRWWSAEGRGTHWIALRDDRTWWWGYDQQPHRIDGQVDQSVVISPSGGYTAHVQSDMRNGWTLVGADTEWGGEGFGGLELPRGAMSPAPRAVAVTDDGLVVARGPRFQWLWRPLVDGGSVDLAETAPGQVVLDGTDAGLVVNEGGYDRTDGQQGAPYLARLAADGALTRLGPVPTHDALEASEQWLAYVPPGTLGGEALGADELQVQRLDGSDPGVLAAPDGWRFDDTDMHWEAPDELLAVLVADDGEEALALCRPARETCELVDLPD